MVFRGIHIIICYLARLSPGQQDLRPPFETATLFLFEPAETSNAVAAIINH
jgi:hypothetical protein